MLLAKDFRPNLILTTNQGEGPEVFRPNQVRTANTGEGA